MPWIRRHPLLTLLCVAAALAALRGIYDLIAELSIQVAAPLEPDAKIYVAVGRAMNNGINTYAEFFENKPPLIFLLTALSLLVTGTHTLAAIVQVLVLAAIPAIIIVYFRRSPLVWMLAGVLFALSLGRYTAVQGGYIQTESLGSFFGIIYLLLLLREKGRGFKRVLLLSLPLLAAGMFKEPLILVIAAAALLLVRDVRQFVNDFVLPAGVAGALGLLFLTVMGYVGPYISIYLPFMLFTHVESRGSPITRALHVDRMFTDFFTFSPYLALAVVVMFLSLLVCVGMRRRVTLVVALFLTSFVVGLGGQYYPHHFIFALPFIVALVFAWKREATENISPFIVTVLLTVGLLVAPVRTALWVRPFWHMDQPQRDAAARFDAMLDACGWDRYLPYGPDTEDLWAHTAHSPYSAAFTLFKLDASRMDPTLADMAFADFNRTPVIAVYPSFVPTLMDQTQGTLLSAFTETPPECAKTFVPMMDSRGQPYVLYFRK
jgi:hypothetical protein